MRSMNAFRIFQAVLVSGAVLVWAPLSQAQQPHFIKIGSGYAGTYPIFCGKLVELINKQIPGVEANAQPGGTEATMVRIQKGEMQMGIGYTFLSHLVSQGKGALEVKAAKLRHLMSLYGSALQVAATQDSGVTDIRDVVEKPVRVYASKPGSVFYPLVVTAFEAHGITFDDIKKAGGLPNPMEYGDLVRMMQDGMIDLGFFSGPVPYSLILELEKNPGVNLIGFSEEALDRYNELLPGTGRTVIPKGSYKSLEQDIKAVYNMNHLFVSADVPEDIVYKITKMIAENLPEFQQLFVGAKEISLDKALRYNPIQVHPGAMRFYKEKGIQ